MELRIIILAVLLIGLIALFSYPFLRKFYYSHSKKPFYITLSGKEYYLEPKSKMNIVEQMQEQDRNRIK